MKIIYAQDRMWTRDSRKLSLTYLLSLTKWMAKRFLREITGILLRAARDKFVKICDHLGDTAHKALCFMPGALFTIELMSASLLSKHFSSVAL